MGPSKPCQVRRRAVYVWLHLVSHIQVAVVVRPYPGHVPLAKRHFIGQDVSRQPGPRPAAHLSTLNRGKGEGFPPVLSPFFNHCRFSFLLFAKLVRVSQWFLGERRVEQGRAELTDSFINPRRDVELEAFQHG